MKQLSFFKTSNIEAKIKAAEKHIIKSYEENNGKLFISFSGGKDSTILMYIALRIYPNLPVVFSNTTNELAEVLKYVKQFPNVITVKPRISFKTVLKTYGFPLVSKEISQKISEMKSTHGEKTRLTRFYGDSKGNGRVSKKWRFLGEQNFDVTAKCCSILKKNPLEQWARKEGSGLKPIIALMSDESRLRQQLALYGKDDGKKIYPFLRSGWTESDIWEAASYLGIRFAECYYDRVINGKFIKARSRTGCEYCGFGITMEKDDRFHRSILTAPKRHEAMMNIKNNGVTFREAIALVKGDDFIPYLDIFGVTPKYSMPFIMNGKKTLLINTDSCTLTKKCKHCESKNIRKGFGHYGNFADAPDPRTGLPRRIFVNSDQGYDCLDCGKMLVTDLHLFNMELGVTFRLIDYISKNLNKKSFAEVCDETGIDFDLAYRIAKSIREKECA